MPADTRVESLRTSQVGSITENRESNLMEFYGIAMATPNKDACQPTRLGFESRQIANAAFICSSSIVDDKNISWLRSSHRFEKNIHAAIMSYRQNVSSNMAFDDQRTNAKVRQS